MMSPRPIVLAMHVTLLLAVGGCRRRGDPSGVSDSAFVATMERLYAIDRDSLLDSAGKAAARRAALQERGLSAQQLERKARSLAADPDHALQLVNRVDSTLRGLRPSPTARAARAIRRSSHGEANDKQELQPAPQPPAGAAKQPVR